MANTNGLREVSRRAVRSKIAQAAEELFAVKGFDATTVDDIAESVGMSQRTFFRYFASKEDAALDSFERQSDDFLARLAGRPSEEAPWDSLRRVFDVVVEQCADAGHRERVAAVHRFIEASPTLLAAYLQKMDCLQQRLLEALVARSSANGRTADEPVLRAVVGAAFACLQAALARTADSLEGEDIATCLDRVMAALRPSCCG
ncbi:TetR family transcriptional regulator [Marinactinospora thermotolerans]|nr:TetR family transcriptional regulator [Marinactinospora thermotolerans]